MLGLDGFPSPRISYPWGVKSMLVPAQGPCRSSKPKLFLVASGDVMCRDGAEGATAEVLALPQPRDFVVVEGDHSWSGNHRSLNRHVLDWLSQHNDAPSSRGGGVRGAQGARLNGGGSSSSNNGSGRKLAIGGGFGGDGGGGADGAVTPRRVGPVTPRSRIGSNSQANGSGFRPRGGPTTPRNGPGVSSNRGGGGGSPVWDQQLRQSSFAGQSNRWGCTS